MSAGTASSAVNGALRCRLVIPHKLDGSGSTAWFPLAGGREVQTGFRAELLPSKRDVTGANLELSQPPSQETLRVDLRVMLSAQVDASEGVDFPFVRYVDEPLRPCLAKTGDLGRDCPPASARSV